LRIGMTVHDLSSVFTLAQISRETEVITSQHTGRNCGIANDNGYKNWCTNMPLYGHTSYTKKFSVARRDNPNLTNT